MSLVIFCLLFSFVDSVPVKGEIIWYLSLTAFLLKKLKIRIKYKNKKNTLIEIIQNMFYQNMQMKITYQDDSQVRIT